MAYILKFAKLALLISAIAVTHFVISYLGFFPLSTANSILASIVLIILFSRSGVVVWLSFLLHYMIDLYALSPFGVVLIAGTLTTILLYWIARDVLTSPSVWVAAVLGTCAIALYRLLHFALLFIFNTFGSTQTFSYSAIGRIFILELPSTLFVVITLYGCVYLVTKQGKARRNIRYARN